MNPAIEYEDPGQWSAIALTVLMHGLLVLALVFSVRWQTRHEAVFVEMWTPPPPARVDVAPPAPPVVRPPPEPVRESPPPPPKPDIALKAPKAKPEKTPPKPDKPAKPEKSTARPAEKAPNFDNLLAREDQQIDRIRADRDRQARAEQEAAMLARAKADAQSQAQRTAREKAVAAYVDKLRGKIRGNLVQPPNLKGNPTARFTVTQLPNGEILEVRLRKASGNPLYDDAVERAIRKSSPLPLPDDRALFERDLEITYCPEPDSSGRCPR
jgi:colicin import membrane protein